MLYKKIELDYSVRTQLETFFVYPGEPEMTEKESAFLSSMILMREPKKILEVGVAAGGTTSIILESLKRNKQDYEMYSVDLNTHFYRNKKKKTGFIAEEYIRKNNVSNHHFLFGKPLPEVIEDIGDGIDFAILDTTHTLPGELLDFLILFPFLKENATIILHDIGLNIINNNNSYATKLLLDLVVGDKYQLEFDDERLIPNIAGFIINDDTKKNIKNVFSGLTINWNSQSSPFQNSYQKIIEKNYNNELSAFYISISKIQGDLEKNIVIKPKSSFYRIIFTSLLIINNKGIIYLFKKLIKKLFT